jgi:exodeoxyribonuclease VII small subunit
MTLKAMMVPKPNPPAEPAGRAAGNGSGHAGSSDPSSDVVSDSADAGSVSAELSFEDAIRRLGHIVEQLERGDLPLEASLRLFEEGVALARVSQRRLDRAERRIEELLGVDADGQPVTRPFEAKIDGG